MCVAQAWSTEIGRLSKMFFIIMASDKRSDLMHKVMKAFIYHMTIIISLTVVGGGRKGYNSKSATKDNNFITGYAP